MDFSFWARFPWGDLWWSHIVSLSPDPKKNVSSFFLFLCAVLIKSCTLCSLICAFCLHEKLAGIIYSFTFRRCTVDTRGWRMGSRWLVKCGTATGNAQIRLFCQGIRKDEIKKRSLLQKTAETPGQVSAPVSKWQNKLFFMQSRQKVVFPSPLCQEWILGFPCKSSRQHWHLEGGECNHVLFNKVTDFLKIMAHCYQIWRCQ